MTPAQKALARGVALLVLFVACWLLIFDGIAGFVDDRIDESRRPHDVVYRCDHGFHVWTTEQGIAVFPAGTRCPEVTP
jgi:hypothetical protein